MNAYRALFVGVASVIIVTAVAELPATFGQRTRTDTASARSVPSSGACDPIPPPPPKQNISDAITTSVACWDTQSSCSRHSAWSRCIAFSEATTVDAVVFGIMRADGPPWTLTVRLWTDNDGGCPPASTSSATVIHEQLVQISSGDAGRLITTALDDSFMFSAGEHVIVEVEAPDGCSLVGPGALFFLGMNQSGETAPSYFRATDCNPADWTPMDGFGFQGYSHVLYLQGPSGGPDCNGNSIPDDCEIENCTGELACSDCNQDGIPDGCQSVNSLIDKFATFGQVPEDIVQAVGSYPPGFYVPDAREPFLWHVSPDGSVVSAFGAGLYYPIGALFVPDEFGGQGWRLFVANQNDSLLPNTPDIVVVDEVGGASVFSDFIHSASGIGMTGLEYLPLSAGGPHAGKLLASSQYSEDGSQPTGSLHAYSPDGTRTTLLPSVGARLFTLTLSPPEFGGLGNLVFTGAALGDAVFQWNPQTNVLTTFATVGLQSGQTGLRQIAFSPVGWFAFLHPDFFDQSLMVVSVSGSLQGLGSNGALAVFDADGRQVARYTQDTVGQIFDPRGLFFHGSRLLVSNAALDNGGIISLSILDFTQGDCDGNGVLDECDFAECPPDDPGCRDCQSNEFLDRCDIESGLSSDINGNGIPDECEPSEVVCNAGVSYAVACGGPSTTIQLDGSQSGGTEGVTLSFHWTTDCPEGSFDDPSAVRPVLTIPATEGGLTCSVGLAVGDGASTATCGAAVTVGVSAPPIIEVAPLMELWPPNHQYRAFTLADCVADVMSPCGGVLDVITTGQILAIYSDEPEDAKGIGDGATLNDIVILGPTSFLLRAERAGGARGRGYQPGNGRVYGVEFAVTDAEGNASTATCKFGVPHDQSGAPPIDDGPEAGYIVRP